MALRKPAKWDIADTNLANFGTKLEKDVRHDVGAAEKAWADPSTGVGNKCGLWVWRIEKFEVKPWPKERYGRFYSGDSYIVLNSYKKKPDSEAISHDIHFWLGLDSSQDEVGAAAYKSVELDDYLGTSPVQHREVQDYESRLFVSYFKRLYIEDGGIDSAFHHVSATEYRPRLLKIKQVKRAMTIREVPKTYASLNSGDVFVLDLGTSLFQFNGSKSSGPERVKAAEFMNAIDAERNGAVKAKKVVDEGDREMSKWWEALGDKGSIADAQSDIGVPVQKKLFRVSDASGALEFTQEAEGQSINKSLLDPSDAFVFDAGHEVFVWIGSGATLKEKRYALQYAQDYIKKFNRPPFTPITRVLQGGENETFEHALQDHGVVV